MSAPNPLIVPTTNAESQPLQGQEADLIVIYTTRQLGAGETVSVMLPRTSSSAIPLYDPALGTPVQLTSTLESVVLPGGFLYRIDKTATAAATGVEVQFKPRIGPH